MARVWLQLCLPFFLFTSALCLDVSQIQVPTNDGISGVLLIQSNSNVYSFNATAAKEACEAIKMRMATKAEVETANKNGLQTCRFGWVEEQIAVIPRIEKSEKCAKNQLGVSVWRADVSKMFDVYCFKTAGSDGSFETTSSRPQSTTGGTMPSNNHYSTKSTHTSSIRSTSTPVYTSRSLPPRTSTPSASSSAFVTFRLSSIRDSSKAATSTQSFSSPKMSSEFSTSSSSASSTHFLLQHSSNPTGHPALSQTAMPDRPSARAPKTLIITSTVLLLLLAAAGAAWYLKTKRQLFTSWSRMRQEEMNETEMFKRINERHCTPEQTSKGNDNSKCNFILKMEQDSS
ncbi:lymphatic vessel endothelial hyaluronic receptor 1b isoform X2 [Puntigrus tetrazona]|uniref:lymphatic vessel endothelial hyaluronic receptor 1b isoform X2 n=1 Tax=Puntigrus tetrazona TaxID=1606681 RepID=UPI001C8A9998|nr:lymphatic vessel endothelial hyaluronic receptor 1b isoform X2 [Puntigrus tetrazona]